MKVRHAAVVAGLALGLMSGAAKAAYIVDINQVGANVVATGMGSIDLSGLTELSPGQDQSFISSPNAAVFVGGLSQVNAPDDTYSGVIGPSSFGNTGSGANGSIATGSIVGLFGSLGFIFVPEGYVSGQDLGVSTAIFSNTTLADLGLTPGTSFNFFFPTDGEGTDTFDVNVGSLSTVPLPASAPMFGAALVALGAVGYGVKRKKAAAVA